MKRIVLLAIFVGVIALIASRRNSLAAEWHGLTETEARSKLDRRIPDRIPTEKRAAAIDMIVAKMKDKGAVVGDDETELTLDLRDPSDQPATSA